MSTALYGERQKTRRQEAVSQRLPSKISTLSPLEASRPEFMHGLMGPSNTHSQSGLVHIWSEQINTTYTSLQLYQHPVNWQKYVSGLLVPHPKGRIYVAKSFTNPRADRVCLNDALPSKWRQQRQQVWNEPKLPPLWFNTRLWHKQGLCSLRGDPVERWFKAALCRAMAPAGVRIDCFLSFDVWEVDMTNT